MSQCERILALLQDGREHEMHDIHRAVGFCRLNSRVAELRARGNDIVCRKQGGLYHYRLLAPLNASETQPAPTDCTRRSAGGDSEALSGEQLTLVAA